MPCHIVDQVKGVDRTAFGDLPALGQTRHGLTIGVELDQAVVEQLGGGVGATGGGDGRIEVTRVGQDRHHQGAPLHCLACRCGGRLGCRLGGGRFGGSGGRIALGRSGCFRGSSGACCESQQQKRCQSRSGPLRHLARASRECEAATLTAAGTEALRHGAARCERTIVRPPPLVSKRCAERAVRC